MILYTWRAGSAEGVTGDDSRARARAGESMRETGAVLAVVETVRYDDGIRSMDTGYVKTGGPRWEARLQGSQVTWSPRSNPDG